MIKILFRMHALLLLARKSPIAELALPCVGMSKAFIVIAVNSLRGHPGSYQSLKFCHDAVWCSLRAPWHDVGWLGKVFNWELCDSRANKLAFQQDMLPEVNSQATIDQTQSITSQYLHRQPPLFTP